MVYLYVSDECRNGSHDCPGERDMPSDPATMCGGGVCTCECHTGPPVPINRPDPRAATDRRPGLPRRPRCMDVPPVTGHQKFDVLREAMNLHSCGGCDRKTTAAYCCGPCADASERHYEIHEDGPLGHTTSCNDRHALRSGS